MLPKLAVLSLSCNRISALERMQHQTSLELLSLADNNITSITGLVTCPHLVGLRLTGNPISKAQGYRLAVLLSAAACGMMELANLDGQPFQDIELAQASCLAWPQRLSALYGWVPGAPFLLVILSQTLRCICIMFVRINGKCTRQETSGILTKKALRFCSLCNGEKTSSADAGWRASMEMAQQ